MKLYRVLLSIVLVIYGTTFSKSLSLNNSELHDLLAACVTKECSDAVRYYSSYQ